MLSIGQPHPAQPQEINPEYEIGVLQSQIGYEDDVILQGLPADIETSKAMSTRSNHLGNRPRKLATGSWLSAA